MKIKIFLATLLLINSSFSIAEPVKKTELLPEVKQLLEIPPLNEQEMDQNAYVYLMAIDAADDNYHEIGKKILLNINKKTRQLLANQHSDIKIYDGITRPYKELEIKRKIAGKDYIAPCANLTNLHCVNDTLNNKQATNLLVKNQKLLERYEYITKLPNYNSYIFTMSSPIPIFTYLFYLSSLQQIKAIDAINHGNIDEGLIILQQELIFFKNILANNHNAFIDNAIAVNQLVKTYHTIEGILDMPIMAKELDNPKLLALLSPLTKQEQQGMAHALHHETKFILINTMTLNNVELDSYINEIKESKRYSGLPKEEKYALTFNKTKTANLFYTHMVAQIKEASVILPEASNYYLKFKDQKIANQLSGKKQIIEKYGVDNTLGGAFLENMPNYRIYIYRLYNVSSYLALINVKLKIKQAKISKQQVADFLTSLGEQAINPYNKQPFVWNIEEQTLTTDWLDSSARSEYYGKQAIIYISFP